MWIWYRICKPKPMLRYVIMIVKPINKRFEVSSLQTYRFEPTNEPINLFCICSLLWWISGEWVVIVWECAINPQKGKSAVAQWLFEWCHRGRVVSRTVGCSESYIRLQGVLAGRQAHEWGVHQLYFGEVEGIILSVAQDKSAIMRLWIKPTNVL